MKDLLLPLPAIRAPSFGSLRCFAVSGIAATFAACGHTSSRDGAFAITTPDGYSLAVARGSGAASVSSNGIATSASAYGPAVGWYGAPATYAYAGWPGGGFINATGAVVAPVGGWYPFCYSSPLWAAPVPQVVPMAQPQQSPYTMTPYMVSPR
jgi:hypothetical protein